MEGSVSKTRRRSRGHIVQRGKDTHSWTIVLSLGFDPSTGKRQRQWVPFKGTKTDAEKRLSELLVKYDTGGLMKSTRLRVGDFLRQWLQDYAEINVRAKTLEGYRYLIERHLIPGQGRIALQQPKPEHIRAFYARCLTDGRLDGREGGLSARTVHTMHVVLNEALSHAVDWGRADRNVAQAVTPPRPIRQEMSVLAPDDVQSVLEAVRGTEWYPLFHLAIWTGLRRSELLGLRWKDVDLDLLQLQVVQTLHRLKVGKAIFEQPKTAKGRRSVALSPLSA
jgi:integrase